MSSVETNNQKKNGAHTKQTNKWMDILWMNEWMKKIETASILIYVIGIVCVVKRRRKKNVLYIGLCMYPMWLVFGFIKIHSCCLWSMSICVCMFGYNNNNENNNNENNNNNNNISNFHSIFTHKDSHTHTEQKKTVSLWTKHHTHFFFCFVAKHSKNLLLTLFSFTFVRSNRYCQHHRRYWIERFVNFLVGLLFFWWSIRFVWLNIFFSLLTNLLIIFFGGNDLKK